ncbi:hypothetical protein H5410_057566 [Solanum commersonii]|uniref:Lipoxygenase domain-containing protein n=1 Tax=Solanum commersonii TaxID=4109 RepID=A0A9J5WQZ0_SOLCO|nr:hypothetical protein H5410_057566 [Solanum commersonii]
MSCFLDGNVHFVCNSWVSPAKRYKSEHIFFANQAYLPGETPEPLRNYREKELVNLRGDGDGKLEEWDRVYDYGLYNYLGDPEKDKQYARTILGGSAEYPYPRRGRTDPKSESRIPLLMSLDIYVPRDERFGHIKLSNFLTYALKSIVQFLIPEFQALFDSTPDEFDSFEDIVLTTMILHILLVRNSACSGKYSNSSSSYSRSTRRGTISFHFHKHEISVSTPSLESVNNDDEVKVDDLNKAMFDSKVSCPNLDTLSISSVNSISVVCSHQLSTAYFTKLETLEVVGCGKLRNLMSPSVAKGLLNLRKLEIEDCQSMEEVIPKGEGIMTLFPLLKYLILSQLPKLGHFFLTRVCS